MQSLLFCDEVIVVDDESTDHTVQEAERAGAKVLSHSKVNEFAGQRNWAMTQAKNEWVFFVDADEVVSNGLQEQIKNIKYLDSVTAYSIPRRDFFWGHEMRFGETKKARTKGIVRLIKKGSGVWTGAVHETFISSGQSEKVGAFLDHYSHDSLSSFIQDINTYSTIRANELQKQGKKVSAAELIFVPFGKFLYSYFVLGGFLDGPAGFVYSFVMSFHSFLVRAKVAAQSYV